MKRLIKYFAVLATIAGISVSCRLGDETFQSKAPGKAGVVEVAVSNVTDNSFDITLTPAGDVKYYSYAVLKSATQKEVDAATLYKGGVKDAVKSSIVKYSADSPTTVVNMASLTPNSKYFVYAVAGGPTGVTGDVVVKEVLTTDSGLPVPSAFSATTSAATITFTEPVVAGQGDFKVDLYAVVLWTGAPDDIYSSTNVSVANAKIAGNVVTLDCEIPAGAMVAVSYPAGIVKDLAGNAVAARNSFWIYSGGFKGAGLRAWLDNEPFSMVEKFADDTTGKASNSLVLKHVFPVAGVAEKLDAAPTLTYARPGKTITLDLDLATDFGLDYDKQLAPVAIPEAPVADDVVTLSLPAGLFYDIFENPSKAWEGSFIGRDPVAADFVGSYVVSGKLVGATKDTTTTLVLAASDLEAKSMWDPAKGAYVNQPLNLKIDHLFGFRSTFKPLASPIYGYYSAEEKTVTFFLNNGELAIPDLYYYSVPNSGTVVFSTPQGGVLAGASVDFGYETKDWDGAGVPLKKFVLQGSTIYAVKQ